MLFSKLSSQVLLSTITNITNLSLSTGVFPEKFKSCSVHPHFKKRNLDQDVLSNYPISYLSILSKLSNRFISDDTQTYLSMSTADFSLNITHHENTIVNVSNWMSAGFLSYSPSKTEFIIFRLPQPFSKLIYLLILLAILVLSLIKMRHMHICAVSKTHILYNTSDPHTYS